MGRYRGFGVVAVAVSWGNHVRFSARKLTGLGWVGVGCVGRGCWERVERVG